MNSMQIYKVQAYSDTLYIKAESKEDARKQLTAKIGEMPDSILTWSTVSSLPPGEEFL